MKAVILVLLVLAVVAVLGRALRREPDAPRVPKPGEDLDRVSYDAPSLGDLTSVGVMPTEEAVVARGLLEAAGIPAFAVPGGPQAPHTRFAPRVMSVGVPPERAEEAAALLRAQFPADE